MAKSSMTRSQRRRTERSALFEAPQRWTAVLAAFFLSGAAGLMHQVVWSKLLVGVIGATAYAQAAVLAVFMGGLALGAAIFGRRVDRCGHPLRTYVKLEILIGAYCLVLPWLLKAASLAYVAIATGFVDAPGLKLLLRLALALAIVAPPAVMMGGTLPLLARHLVGRAVDTQRAVARLYGLNSLGAVLGAGVAGFALLPFFGVYPSLVVASVLNFIAAALLVSGARTEQSGPVALAAQASDPSAEPERTYRPHQYAVTLIALALSGFAAMGYEVLFVRVIALSFGLSVYSFTVMLMCFITGISIGSLIIARVKVRRPLWLLGVSQFAVVIALLAMTPLIERLPYLIGLFRIQMHDSGGFELYQVGKAALCLAILLLPTTCLGLSFPLVAQIQVRRSPRLGGHIGSTYAWNTMGNVAGAVLTSIVLLPALGLLHAFHVNFAMNLLAGGLLLAVASETFVSRRLIATGAACGAVALYLALGSNWLQPLRLARNHLRMSTRPASFTAWKSRYVSSEDEASHFMIEDDAHATILVYGDYEQIRLYVNGKPDASTNRDLPTQMFLAHFPLMLRPDARSLCVIGHGSGITAGSALRHPLEHADIVEISRGVLNADALFAELNYNVLDDPRVHVHEEDGQSFLRTASRKYDLIISEPSNPWVAGIAGLFTVEYFEDIRDALTPSGVAAIWFHEYEQDDDGVQLVLRSIQSVFPHLEVFRSPDYMDIIVVASLEPIEPDFAAMEDRFDDPAIRNDFSRIRICNLGGVLMQHSVSDERLPTLLKPGPLNTVWNARLEYSAPRAYFNRSSSRFLRDSDSMYSTETLGEDTLLAAYMAYRRTEGEPMTAAELEDIAGTAEFQGWSNRTHVAPVMRELALNAPQSQGTPSRPSRGLIASPSTMGLSEANYWYTRFTDVGQPQAARPFGRRVNRLNAESEKGDR